MSKLYCDNDKYGYQCEFPISEAYNAAIKDLMRQHLEGNDAAWETVVFGSEYDAITKDAMQSVEDEILELGYRFEPSAMSSPRERPDAYKDSGLFEEDFSFEHPDAPTADVDSYGRELRGAGDNVVTHSQNLFGTARYVRTIDAVLECLNNGVAAETIAIVDDSGGTLTAPVLEKFHGVLCAGGTTRSHLAILTREYNIPCFMNVRLSGIKDGDKLEMEVSGKAKSAEDYDAGRDASAKVWRIP